MAYVIPVSDLLNKVLNNLGSISDEPIKPANDVIQDNKQTSSKDV